MTRKKEKEAKIVAENIRAKVTELNELIEKGYEYGMRIELRTRCAPQNIRITAMPNALLVTGIKIVKTTNL